METDAPPAAADGPRRVGAVLAEARAAAHLELADIARDTRVPLRHLRAIETDDHDALPALPYAIGFVKSFARAVHLDAELVAAQFRAQTSKSAHTPVVTEIASLDARRAPPRGLTTLSIVVGIAVIGAVVAYSAGLFAPTPAAPPALSAAAGAGAAPAVDAPVTEPPAGASPATAAVPFASPPAAATSPSTAAAPMAASGPVSLTATEDVWIKVYDRATRTTVKIGSLAAGERYDVPAEPAGLMLWTGRAGALKVAVGGRVLPPLGGPAQTVKDVSLAPADLVARTSAAGVATGTAAP